MYKTKTFLLYIIAIIYIIASAYFIAKEDVLFVTLINIIPFILILVYITVISLDKLLFLIIFLTPISIPATYFIPGLENNISLPVEPLLFGVLILFIVKLLFEKKYDKNIFKHPIAIAIFLNIIWMFVTSISSSMPIVSFKFLLSRMWFLATFFFLAAHLFKDIKNIYTYLWLFIIGFSIVVIYALYSHSIVGLFNQKASNQAVRPFLPDHTSYAAIIAMLIPFVIGMFGIKRFNKLKRWLFAITLFILFIGIIFSYTRAAWLSLIGALFVYLIMLFKIKFKIILLTTISIIAIFFTFKTQIFISLERNNQDSNDNFTEHIESMSNISTDASNLERINRWNSAIRMFKDKPIFGFGPATYMFKYAPYQLASEKTIISTNSGDVGNAHSEYLGPLSESGLFGFLSIILVFILTGYTAVNLYNKSTNTEIKLLVMVLFLGLITYYIHGVLNNFLDLVKNSAIFWGFTAAILALDLYHNKKNIS